MVLNLCHSDFENDRKTLSEIRFKMQVGRWKEGRMMSAKPGLSFHHIDLFACIELCILLLVWKINRIKIKATWSAWSSPMEQYCQGEDLDEERNILNCEMVCVSVIVLRVVVLIILIILTWITPHPPSEEFGQLTKMGKQWRRTSRQPRRSRPSPCWRTCMTPRPSMSPSPRSLEPQKGSSWEGTWARAALPPFTMG